MYFCLLVRTCHFSCTLVMPLVLVQFDMSSTFARLRNFSLSPEQELQQFSSCWFRFFNFPEPKRRNFYRETFPMRCMTFPVTILWCRARLCILMYSKLTRLCVQVFGFAVGFDLTLLLFATTFVILPRSFACLGTPWPLTFAENFAESLWQALLQWTTLCRRSLHFRTLSSGF